MNKNTSPWTSETTSFPKRVLELIEATNNLLKWNLWYLERWIEIKNGKWRNVKDNFDQIKEPLDALGRTLSAYDTITEAASIAEKKWLSGEIGLLQTSITLIYGDAATKNSIHHNLKNIAPYLWKWEVVFLTVDLWESLRAQIEELKMLESPIKTGDKEAEQKFLTLSWHILESIRLYYRLAKKVLEYRNEK